jgi:hypothetical protein
MYQATQRRVEDHGRQLESKARDQVASKLPERWKAEDFKAILSK